MASSKDKGSRPSSLVIGSEAVATDIGAHGLRSAAVPVNCSISRALISRRQARASQARSAWLCCLACGCARLASQHVHTDYRQEKALWASRHDYPDGFRDLPATRSMGQKAATVVLRAVERRQMAGEPGCYRNTDSSWADFLQRYWLDQGIWRGVEGVLSSRRRDELNTAVSGITCNQPLPYTCCSPARGNLRPSPPTDQGNSGRSSKKTISTLLALVPPNISSAHHLTHPAYGS